MKIFNILSILLKLTSPNSLNLAWKVLKGDTIRLQPWFIIRRVSWLYIVAYTSGCHKDYRGDWLHRGLLHSFWRWKILVWNLVFISLGGQFGCGYIIPMATRRIVQSSLKVRDGVSFFFKVESARPVPFLPQPKRICPRVCSPFRKGPLRGPLGPIPNAICLYFGDLNSNTWPHLHHHEKMAKIDSSLLLLKKSRVD